MMASPQLVAPSQRPLPVATRILPDASTTAPDRPQIAEPLCAHELGSMIPVRLLHNEFHVLRIWPVEELSNVT